MKRLWFLVILGLITNCASTQPITQAEMWPKFNTDPTLGVVILRGAASCTIKFINAATNEIQKEWSDRGESPTLTFNGEVPARVYITNLPKGLWRLEIQTFYYQTSFFPPSRRLISLYRYTDWVSVQNDPRIFHNDYYTRTEWGWGKIIHTGNIPQYDYQSPTIDIQSSGIATDIVNFARSLFQ